MIISKSLIKELDSYKNENIEIEFRFGTFKNSKNGHQFIPGVRKAEFIRLKKFLQAYQNTKSCSIVDISLEGIRRIQNSEMNKTNTIFQTKKNIKNIDIIEYGIRLSVSSEQEIDPINNFNSNYQRIRERTSYNINEKYKVDITKVMQTNFLTDNVKFPCNMLSSKNLYEVEIELLNKKYLESFLKFVDEIFVQMKQTKNIYSIEETTEMKKEIGNLVNNDYFLENMELINNNYSKQNIHKQMLVVARNLKFNDLVYNGIIKGKGSPYHVAFKADGIRKLLIVSSNGIWLHFPPYEYNLLIKSGESKEIDSLIKKFEGSVFDGEQVKFFSNRAEYEYLLFDCINTCNTNANPKCNNLYNKNYESRLKTCKFFEKKFNEVMENSNMKNLIYVKTKDTFKIESEQNFFDIINEMLNSKEKLDFSEDGLTFTPNNAYYNPFSIRKDREKKLGLSLVNYPDVCKWKPVEELTIDFEIQKTVEGKIILNVTKNVNGKFLSVPFQGTKKYPLTEDMIDHENNLTKDLPSGFIIEYRVIFDNEKPLLIPKMIREDKDSPNPDYVAEDVWSDIMEPITEETLRGNNMKLVEEYHKKIKSDLLSKIKKDENTIHLHFGQFNHTEHYDLIKSDTICIERERNQFFKLLETHENSFNFSNDNCYLVKKLLKNKKNNLILFFNKKVNGEIDYMNEKIPFDDLNNQYKCIFENLNTSDEIFFMTPIENIENNFIPLLFKELGFFGSYKIANEEKLLTQKQKDYSSNFIYGIFTKKNISTNKISNSILIKDFIDMYGNLTNYLVSMVENVNIDYNGKIIFAKKFKDIEKFTSIEFILICNKGFEETNDFKYLSPLKYISI